MGHTACMQSVNWKNWRKETTRETVIDMIILKWIFKKTVCEVWMYVRGSGEGLAVGFYEHANELLVFLREREFRVCLSDC
jgi:hypothetical protein